MTKFQIGQQPDGTFVLRFATNNLRCEVAVHRSELEDAHTAIGNILAQTAETKVNAPPTAEDAMWRIISAADQHEQEYEVGLVVHTIPDDRVWQEGIALGLERKYLHPTGVPGRQRLSVTARGKLALRK